MRQLDENVQLVVCGSSGATMPTFGEWERVVLGHTYEDVDFISCHAYYQERDGDLASFLASAVDMDRFIETVVATADHVKALKRSDHDVNISFDEWNVWYMDRFQNVEKIKGIGNWPTAPRLLEDVYSVADAVVVGDLLLSLLRHADRVKAASLAQLVNVIAPIMTEPGGPAWRQTTFFPFAVTARLARGTSLRTLVSCDKYRTASYGDVDVVDTAATYDEDAGRAALFLVNRHLTEPATVTVDLRSLPAMDILEAPMLSDPDVYAKNTLTEPDRVTLRSNDTATCKDGVLTVTLPPVSWTALSLG